VALTRSILGRIGAAVATVAVAACGQPPPLDHEVPAPNLVLTSTPVVERDDLAGWTETEQRAHGDAAHGKALIARYECNRCHAGTGEPAPMFERQCVGCHKLIAAGTLPFARDRAEAWRSQTRHYITTPSLTAIGARLRPSWIASFLHEPVKVRPHEEEWMPRLAISENDARDIAEFLTSGASARSETRIDGDVERGKTVVAQKGCFLCHELTGAARADVEMVVPSLAPERLARGMTQAPDLRLARERFRPDALVQWIRDPASLRPGTDMPSLGLTDQEARDAAAYILRTPLAPRPAEGPALARLPLLDRHVSYEEVAARVFRRSCTHCHAEPSGNGDPGPGSTGGFGFAPRGVQLLTYRGTQLGYIAAGGARRSLFAHEPELEPWGGARLVAALVARHEETSGRPVAAVRGMPMGLPGLSAEEIQLVETWVSEGAPKE
jgi:cytochrome c2